MKRHLTMLGVLVVVLVAMLLTAVPASAQTSWGVGVSVGGPRYYAQFGYGYPGYYPYYGYPYHRYYGYPYYARPC